MCPCPSERDHPVMEDLAALAAVAIAQEWDVWRWRRAVQRMMCLHGVG